MKTYGNNLWEIPKRYHHSILALCLNENEVRGVVSRMGSQAESCVYSCYFDLTRVTAHVCTTSRNIQELLDRKYQITMESYAAVGSEQQLYRRFEQTLTKSGMRGSYWAIMRHSSTSPDLMEQVFRLTEVCSLQRLSQAVFQENKVCRLQSLLADLNEDMEAVKRTNCKRVCQYCTRIRELESELTHAEYTIGKLNRQLQLMRFRETLKETY